MAKMIESGGTTVLAAVIALVAAWFARQGVRETNAAAREREELQRREQERIRQDELRRLAYLDFLQAYQVWADRAYWGDPYLPETTPEQDEALIRYQFCALNVRLITDDTGVLEALDRANEDLREDSDPTDWTHRSRGRDTFIAAVLAEKNRRRTEVSPGPGTTAG